MTVKGQVKEIVQEIKRHFSHHKHHRDESSTSSHTLVSDDSSHTAHSGGHSRPGTPEGELNSHHGTPEHGDFVPTTPERKRVLSTSHKHSVFLKLRRRKSSILSTDPHSKTPEHDVVFPGGSQPVTPEHSATLSNPGTPESSLFSHGNARQRVPSTPTRKPNVLHRLRRGSSHFKSNSESHSPEKTEIPVIHHHSSLSKLREHVDSYTSEKTVTPVIHHQSSSSKLREDQDVFQGDVPGAEVDREVAQTAAAEDGESTLGPLPIIVTSPPMEEKTESHGDTLHSSKYEGGGDIIDRLGVQLECDPVPETEEKETGEDTGSFVQVEDVQIQTDLDTTQSRVDAEAQTSPATLVAPISQEACDSPSVPELAVVIDFDSALNPDGNDRKSVDDPVVPAVIDTLVAQKACDSPSVPEPAAAIHFDPALNPDGNDRKSIDDPVDPPVLLVAPISQEARDSPSVPEPAAVTDPALNPDGNDRKSIDDPVDLPVLAVIDHDQDLPTKDVDEPTKSEMHSAKDNDDAEDQAQSTLDTSPSEETTLAQSVPSPTPEPVNTPPPAVVDKPTPASPALEHQPYPQAHPAPPAPIPAFNTSPYLPRLTAPTMFLPIPNTDPLSPLLTKHVPPEQRPRRDVTGEWTSKEMHEMVMSNSWRALARMARDLIVASDPEDLPRILDLWSLRLSALARLRLTNQASAECTNLFAVLNAIPPTASSAANLVSSTVTGLATGSSVILHSPTVSATPKSPAAIRPQSPAALSSPSTPTQRPSPLPAAAGHVQPQARVLATRLSALSAYPFELSVLRARVHYWAGDARGYIDALAGLLTGCKAKARAESKAVRDLTEAKMAAKQRKEEDKSEGTAEPGGERDNQKEGCEEEDESAEEDDEDEDARLDDQSEEGENSEEGNNQEEEEEEGSNEQRKADAADGADADDDDESDGALATAEANFSMWLERSARVCLMIASQLVEMKDYHAAITLLTPLCTQQLSPSTDAPPVPSPAIHSAVARIYLLSGNIPKAAEHFKIVASCADVEPGTIAMNTALLCSASGDWQRAEAALREVLEQDPRNYTAMNNLAVTLLAQGRVRDGIGLLEQAMQASPASVLSAEPFIFNLSTLYELRSSTAIDKKRELLIEVARWSGDGLRATCLKMPSS